MSISKLIDERAKLFVIYRQKKAELDDLMNEIAKIDATIIEWLEENEADSIVSSSGAKASLKKKLRVNVPKEREAEWIDHVRTLGFDGVIKEGIHHSTQTKLINDMIQEGLPIPDYVGIYWQPSIDFDVSSYSIQE